ncbi:hypothetical protein [uncultured Roseobacter sp.]|uniref:hypothetical protein n=1 Tax=uncultured Roseobacter sp. TaxID=114847 RepID=UPI002609FD74|nr:hypothetical protein [uncultured Roseobacter sp.]
MTLRSALSRAGLALVLLASLAMSAAAFTHRVTQGSQTPDLLAYLSMGGTLAELCGEAGAAHHLTAGCDACRISANALAPDQTPDTTAPLRYARVEHAGVPAPLAAPEHTDVRPPSRAPPFG